MKRQHGTTWVKGQSLAYGWNAVSSSLLLFLVVISWLLFAPQKFGGQASLILIDGNSMLPNFETNDLVVVRRAQQYAVGDAVAYRHEELGIVFHRIIETDGNLFVLQGDNNEFIDTFRPNASQVIGIEWLHLPAVGRFLQRLRINPIWMAGLIFGLVVWALSHTTYVGTQGQSNASKKEPALMNDHNQFRDEWIGFALFLLFLSGFGLWYSYRQPLSVTSQMPIPYTHQVTFNYSAVAAADVYDATIIAAGEPVFRRLSDSVTLAVTYEIESERAVAAGGTYQLFAELSDVNGWKRILTLAPPTSFDALPVTAHATLRLDELQSIIDTVQQETGVVRAQYQVRILSHFSTDGEVARLPMEDAFSAEFAFELTNLELRPRLDPSQAGNGLIQSQSKSVIQPTVIANTISPFGYAIPMASLRTITLTTFVLNLIALLWLGYGSLRPQKASSANVILADHLSLVVDVKTDPFTLANNRIGLKTIDDLLKVAQQTQQVIMRYQDRLAVHSNATLYYFVLEPEESKPKVAKEAQPREAIA